MKKKEIFFINTYKIATVFINLRFCFCLRAYVNNLNVENTKSNKFLVGKIKSNKIIGQLSYKATSKSSTKLSITLYRRVDVDEKINNFAKQKVGKISSSYNAKTCFSFILCHHFVVLFSFHLLCKKKKIKNEKHILNLVF